MAEEDPQEKVDRERIFKRFDTNDDGKISASELGDALKTLGCVQSDEVKFMMAEIDTDGDGYISYQEYIAFALANRGLMKDIAKDIFSYMFSSIYLFHSLLCVFMRLIS
ncbi:polcalcin Bet v 4 [Prunus yedoensis var. nudiflora]|uniref:Polcalcin Bet v 4 n=1 Tax=Prunus yedoensis var. nudiflora TaxID=2094558 RepID=A0A314YM00_PRUYE|nr:polcalcin Bet v 4 [Prunus yedoensis var. nudiflora]